MGTRAETLIALLAGGGVRREGRGGVVGGDTVTPYISKQQRQTLDWMSEFLNTSKRENAFCKQCQACILGTSM